jgi:glycosyltransferase involved in cell wall biosynthesis
MDEPFSTTARLAHDPRNRAPMRRPLRILQVTDLFEPFIGGMEQHVRALSLTLVQRGHEVLVATAQIPGTAPTEDLDGFMIKRIAGWSAQALARWYERTEAPFHPPIPDPGVVASLRHIIREFRPDVVHAQGWISYSCMALAKRCAPPLIVTLHDHSFACVRKTLMHEGRQVCAGPQLSRCLRCSPGQYGIAKGAALTIGLRAVRPLHERVDSWVAISQYVSQASRGIVPRSRTIDVIPPTSQPPPPSGQRPAWLPADGYALFVGALGYHKGLNWLLDVYAGGGFRRPLLVIGTPRHDTPRTWPSGVEIRANVPHQEVLEAWRHAGIGLVPSLWPEPFGLVAVEAMRSGVPVVASRIGALPRIVDDGITGILVTPGTNELRAAMLRFDNEPGLRQKMGSAALVRAEQFSAETITSQYEEQYYRVLAAETQGAD